MAEAFPDLIFRKLKQVSGLYHRLVLVVAPWGAGKTRALLEVSRRIRIPVVNINLELARRLLDLTARQRTLEVPRLLDEIAIQAGSQLLLLDNIEILFDRSLRQDPLRLLQGVSRNRTVVAVWNGSVKDGCLTYAEPGHPEYCRYPMGDFLVAGPEVPG